MNKKISTFMAGALLVGALVTPADLLAAIKYKAGKSYDTATEVTAALSSSETGYMVLVDDAGNNYVVTVNNNAMVATPFADALLSTSEMTIDGTLSVNTKFSFTVDGNAVGFGSGTAWGSTTVEFTGSECDMAQGAMKIAINSANQSVKLDKATATFALDNTSATNTMAVKFINASDLEAVDATSTIDLSKDFNFSKYYVLMDANGQAYEGQANGTATAKAFAANNAAFYWNVVKDANTGYATLKNVGTEELLKVGSDLVVVKLDATGKKIENTTNVVTLLKNEDHATASVTVRFGAAPSLQL